MKIKKTDILTECNSGRSLNNKNNNLNWTGSCPSGVLTLLYMYFLVNL